MSKRASREDPDDEEVVRMNMSDEDVESDDSGEGSIQMSTKVSPSGDPKEDEYDENSRRLKHLHMWRIMLAFVEMICGLVMIIALTTSGEHYRTVGFVFTGDREDNPLYNTSALETDPIIRETYFTSEAGISIGIWGGVGLILDGLCNLLLYFQFNEVSVKQRTSTGAIRLFQALALSITTIFQICVITRIHDAFLITNIAWILGLRVIIEAAIEQSVQNGIVIQTVAAKIHNWVYVYGILSMLLEWTIIMANAMFHDDKWELPDYVWVIIILSFLYHIADSIFMFLYMQNYLHFLVRVQLTMITSGVYILLQTWLVFAYDIE